MSVLPLIIKREYIARVRNKSFVIMTFLSPLIMVGMMFLIGYLTQLNGDTKRTIAIVDEVGSYFSTFKTTDNTTYIDLTDQGFATAKQLAEEGTYYALIHVSTKNAAPDFRFYSEETPSIELVEKLERILEQRLKDDKLINQGVNPKDIAIDFNLGIENFSGEKTSKLSGWIKAGFGGIAGYLLMMFIIIYGNMVMRSVIEEKTNRIIEVIISSVKPFQLMMGKILGTTLAGITQFSIWVIIGAVLLGVATTFFGLDASTTMNTDVQQVVQDPSIAIQALEEIKQLPLLMLVVGFFIYFTGGYFLYSSIYAAIGAAVDSETDTQQFMLPIIMPLMLAIYIGFFAVINNPHGTVATVFSIIPLTSPIVMLMRIPFVVPAWQLILSITLLIGSFTFTVWMGSKIYRVGILMYGKKPTYKELFKWLKY